VLAVCVTHGRGWKPPLHAGLHSETRLFPLKQKTGALLFAPWAPSCCRGDRVGRLYMCIWWGQPLPVPHDCCLWSARFLWGAAVSSWERQNQWHAPVVFRVRSRLAPRLPQDAVELPAAVFVPLPRALLPSAERPVPPLLTHAPPCAHLAARVVQQRAQGCAVGGAPAVVQRVAGGLPLIERLYCCVQHLAHGPVAALNTARLPKAGKVCAVSRDMGGRHHHRPPHI
jgi:hypothetical protein